MLQETKGTLSLAQRDIVIIPRRRGSGMTFKELTRLFPTEKAAIDYFFQIRYKGVLTCPHCGSTVSVYRYRYRNKVCHCHFCNNSFSPFSNTIFEKTHVDMRDWFYAINQLAINARKGISACHLKRDIGVSYKTALRMVHQLRKAMENVDMKKAFGAIVEIDETYLGGKPRKPNAIRGPDGNLIPVMKNKRGRGTGKTPVLGAYERNTGRAYIKVAVPNEEGKELTEKQMFGFTDEICKDTTTVLTDGFKSYNILDRDEEKFIHNKVIHSEGEYCNSKHPWIHTNGIESVWALVKRAHTGIYHHYSGKYKQRYMDEVAFRQSHRTDDRTFDVLLEQAIGA
jgi:transposase-like protein